MDILTGVHYKFCHYNFVGLVPHPCRFGILLLYPLACCKNFCRSVNEFLATTISDTHLVYDNIKKEI